MIKNKYVLLLISKLFTKLQDAQYFTKLDIYQRFNNVSVKSSNKQKKAFYINCRLFEPLTMFFDMSNSPAIFQAMINDIFWNLIVESIMIMYLNNILIFIWTLKDYYKVVCRVLKVLVKHKLSLHSEKYEYLYLVISEDQVKINPMQFARVCIWPLPTTHKNLQVFLSFTNFYQKFTFRFLNIAHLLFDMARSNIIWDWDPIQ